MIRKLLCWLGIGHKWYRPCTECRAYKWGQCSKCEFEDLEYSDEVCWHCGAIKR